MRRLTASFVFAALAACSGDPGTGPVDGPTVHLAFGRGSFFDAPVPSDDLAGSDGKIDVMAWPDPTGIPYVETVKQVASARTGFGLTGGIVLTTSRQADVDGLDVFRTLDADSPVFLVAVDGPTAGRRVPIDVYSFADGGPYGAPNLLSAVPLQGVPLDPDVTWALVITTALTAGGQNFAPAAEILSLEAGAGLVGVAPATSAAWGDAVAALADLGVAPGEIAGLALYRTDDPTAAMRVALEAASAESLPPPDNLGLTDVFDEFCVWQGTVDWPVYQGGEPPYLTEGGAWVFGDDGEPVLQRWETGRIWVTVPRAPAPATGWPIGVMIRTGGGGDRPLVDRGIQAEEGGEAITPGTGPAEVFAQAGLAGVSFDGDLGGLRNTTGADEQFLVFNFQNPSALRDNVRQSALEVALLPGRLDGLALDPTGCDGAEARFDTSRIALLGHSMGATIAPLALAVEPRYGAAVLSGAGGSYADNLLYKQLPLETRPIAEGLLGYAAVGRSLEEGDPFLQLLQWAAEDADPPAYAPAIEDHRTNVLMVQGIIDHYILPPISEATSLSLGLDFAGPALDVGEPELDPFRPLDDVLPFGGGQRVDLPAAPRDGRTAVVVQVHSDGIEDGHEVLFQTEEARRSYRCFLQSWAAGAATVPASSTTESDPCE